MVSCQNAIDPNTDEELKKVSINSSEVFKYNTGIGGDEELVTITQQPQHFETSEIVRDSTTNWQAVYRYKANSGFKGTNHVVLKLGTDGAGPNTNIKMITIEITVN